ncbi:MAG TPA: hypothetical protein VD884_18270 [Ohtaekwangia sp.]|nr:hypothetical protein [Ohtaekwangia sp.]
MKLYRYLFLLLTLFVQTGFAQTTYPLQVNVHLLPPYSLYLSDYYSGTREKLTVTLINRDQLKPSVNVRLRMIITAPGGIRIQTNDNVPYVPVNVEAGMPVRITQDDLAQYFQPRNLITQGYLSSGRMPEGMVEFCFQAVEAFTGQVLSASSCTRAWITSQKPPLLSLPLNEENVAFRDPLNMLFQWTPMHQGLAHVEYDFIIKELWDNGMAPQAAFPYAPEIYRETLRGTSLSWGAMHPPLLPGKRYAWCIQAKARDGMDEVNVFQNDGYSEIRWFTLQDNCMPPNFVEAIAERKRISLMWGTRPEHVGFTVSYRLIKSKTTTLTTGDQVEAGAWKELQVNEPNAVLYGLQSGGTYEYRVASLCMTGVPVYGDIFTVTLPATDSARLAQCGIMPEVNLLNQEPIQELKTSEVFVAGDFPITITRLSGANGTYTGEGWTVIPWLNDAKVAVEFTTIVINTDKQMISGFVEAQYDKNESQVANADDVFEGGFDQGVVKTGLTQVDYSFDFSIPGVESFMLDDEGTLVITDSDGNEHAVTAQTSMEGGQNEGDKVVVFPMTVKDKDGNVFLVEKVTETDAAGNTSTVAKATRIGNMGATLAEDSFDRTQLDFEKAIVTFSKGSGYYAFDTWEAYYDKISLIESKYEKLHTDYYVPWKLLVSGKTDVVSAAIRINDPIIDVDKVEFKTPKGVTLTASREGNVYTIQLVDGPAGDVQELYALYPKGDGKYWNLGKLSIATYAPQRHDVVLVSVKGTVIDSGIEAKLKEVYDPVGVTFNVSRDTMEYDPEQLMMQSTGLSTYNEAMRTLNNTYRARRTSFNRKANYLFFLKATGNVDINNRDFTGFMPRGGQFGYIFTSEIKDINEPVTVAHELGHGRFKLYHTFDKHYGGYEKGNTTNIMDYSNKTHFAKWQWDQVHDPAMVVGVFEGDEKSEYSTGEYFSKLLQQIRCAYASGIDQIQMPEKYRSDKGGEVGAFDYGLSVSEDEINGLKIRSASWKTSGGTSISGLLTPRVDASRGEIQFGNFLIKVSAAVYNINDGLSPFEHFRRYLCPVESEITAEFNKVWDSGIKQKIAMNEEPSTQDIDYVKQIASCASRHLDVDSRYKLIQAIMDYSTTEYYEDLLLDIIQTTPAGVPSKDLFTKINQNKKLLDQLISTMDNLWGEEKNFDRLAKEYYALFTRGHTPSELNDKYAELAENRKLFFYGFGHICAWSISASRNYDVLSFDEHQVFNVEYRTYNPTQDGSSIPTCDSNDETYDIGIQELVAVSFLSDNFLGKKGATVLIPAPVYYILIKSHWNEEYYQAANAAWAAIGIVTPIDEFFLIGKALQYGSRGLKALRFSSVKTLAKNKKILVPLTDEGISLRRLGEERNVKVDDFVEWGVVKGADDFADYVKTLKTKVNPRRDYPDGIFERHVTGDDIQYEAIGGGEKIWADGIDSGKKALLDAKHNPGTFYTIESYNQKPFLYGDLEDEFRRYSKIILDKSNPVDELVIFISQGNQSSVKLFEHLGSKYNVPVKVELVPWNP